MGRTDFGRALLVLLACGACARPRLDLGAEPGTLLVYAALDDGKSVTRAGVIVRDESPYVTADLHAEDVLITWQLPPGSLVDVSGDALGATALAGLGARSLREARGALGACDRCAAPSLDGPQLVLDGDSCSVPAFAEAQLWRPNGASFEQSSGPDDQLAIDVARVQLRIEAPGECGCRARPWPRLLDFEMEAVAPSEAPEYVLAIDADDAGNLYGSFPGHLYRYDAASGRGEILPLPGDELLSPVYGLALEDGGYLVAMEDPGAGDFNHHRIFKYRAQRGGPVTGGELSYDGRFSVDVMRRPLRDPQHRVLIGGDTTALAGRLPTLLVCSPSGESCTIENLQCAGVAGENIVQVDADSNGALIATTPQHMFYQAPGSFEWQCFKWPQQVRRDNGQLVTIHRVEGVEFGSRRLGFCAQSDVGGLFMTVPTGDLPDLEAGTRTTTIALCDQFLHGPVADEFTFVGGGYVTRLGADGQWLEQQPLYLTYGQQNSELAPLSNGQVLGRDIGNVVSVGPLMGPLHTVRGPSESQSNYHHLQKLADGRVLALSSPPGAVLIEGERVETFRDLDAVLGQGVIAHGSWDTARSLALGLPSLVILYYGQGAHYLRVSLENGRFSHMETLPWPVTSPQHIQELAPNRFFILNRTGDGAVYVPEEAEPVRVVSTAADFMRWGLRPDSSSVLQAQHGVAWLSLGEATVLRFAGERAERFTFDPAVKVDSLDVDCPNDVVITGNTTDNNDETHSASYAIQPKLDVEESDATDLAKLSFPPEVTASNGSNRVYLRDEQTLGVVDSRGMLRRYGPGEPKFLYVGIPTNRVVLTRSTVTSLSSGGRIAVGKPR